MAQSQGLYTQGKDPSTGLTRRQGDVLRMLTEENKSQLDVANELGISRQRVRQIVEDLQRKGFQIPNAKRPGA